jgi:drug/metabolite transporter (DMT)-like permease
MFGYVGGLVLFAALLHATWNALLHGNRDRFRSMTWMSIGITILSAVAIPFLPMPLSVAWPYIIASGLVHIGYNISLVRAYRTGELGEAYPISRGSSPLLVALGAALFAREHLAPVHILGIALVSCGIISLALQRGHVSRRATIWALITGATIAAYTVIDGMGVRLSGHSVSYTAWMFLFYLLMPVLFIQRRGAAALRAPTADIASSIGGGFLSVAAYGIVIWAMQSSAMGSVSALRETSVLFAALIGRIFLKEKLTFGRMASCLVIALGAICIGA